MLRADRRVFVELERIALQDLDVLGIRKLSGTATAVQKITAEWCGGLFAGTGGG